MARPELAAGGAAQQGVADLGTVDRQVGVGLGQSAALAGVVVERVEPHLAWPGSATVESRHIPTTNNATEEVIRIFTQHSKTFCSFENVESARCYLAVFEKVYRFTLFSDDAQEWIRGRCPLELAGYEVHKLPMAHLVRGLALQWPASAFQELVPKV